MTWHGGAPISSPRVPKNILADTQGGLDERGLALQRAGITGLRLPVPLTDQDGTTHTTLVTAAAWVAVPATARGTHMSRLVEEVGTWRAGLVLANLPAWLETLATRMESDTVGTNLDFTLFLERPAPASGKDSWLDFTASVRGDRTAAAVTMYAEVTVPVKMLCPCSKEIATDGAHAQRAHLTARVWPRDTLPCLRDLAAQVEGHASARLHSVLKRADEKIVTEGAYANPRFAEDVVREVANDLARSNRYHRWQVRVLNFESIHNHQVFAEANSATTEQ